MPPQILRQEVTFPAPYTDSDIGHIYNNTRKASYHCLSFSFNVQNAPHGL